MPAVPTDNSLVALQRVMREVAVYPPQAYEFVRQGLSFSVCQKYPGAGEGVLATASDSPPVEKIPARHVSGPELCHGLKLLAQQRWGRLARCVLARWNITCTYDFGRIIYALIDGGLLRKNEGDCIEDFRNVYDFARVFELDYQLTCEGL